MKFEPIKPQKKPRFYKNYLIFVILNYINPKNRD